MFEETRGGTSTDGASVLRVLRGGSPFLAAHSSRETPSARKFWIHLNSTPSVADGSEHAIRTNASAASTAATASSEVVLMSARYLPHLLYSMAITSLGMHLLQQRKAAEADCARFGAQVSILESTVHRLRSGEVISERELERLKKLARHPEELPASAVTEEEPIGWREVLLGRKHTTSTAASEEWDRKDMEKVRIEVEASS